MDSASTDSTDSTQLISSNLNNSSTQTNLISNPTINISLTSSSTQYSNHLLATNDSRRRRVVIFEKDEWIDNNLIKKYKVPLYIMESDDYYTESPRKLPKNTFRLAESTNSHIRIRWESIPKTVLIIKKHNDKELLNTLLEIAQYLISEYNVTIIIEKSVLLELDNNDLNFIEMNSEDPGDGVDYIICIGGDGTVLHLSSLFKGASAIPPAICFNAGSLGFLTVHEVSDYRILLDRLMQNIQSNVKKDITQPTTPTVLTSHCTAISSLPYKIDRKMSTSSVSRSHLSQKSYIYGLPVFVLPRMRLYCCVFRATNESKVRVASFQPLNELLIDRGTSPYLSNLELYIDGMMVTAVQADGLIVSTPTGSSAYSMSAGGALTAPSVASVLVTPICPHTLSFRPLVLPDSTRIKIRLPVGARASAWASFDGRGQTEMKPGDYVEVVMSRYPVPTITFCEHNLEWFHSIVHKLHWNVRPTQKPLNNSAL